jgi:hypothetical protein
MSCCAGTWCAWHSAASLLSSALLWVSGERVESRWPSSSHRLCAEPVAPAEQRARQFPEPRTLKGYFWRASLVGGGGFIVTAVRVFPRFSSSSAARCVSLPLHHIPHAAAQGAPSPPPLPFSAVPRDYFQVPSFPRRPTPRYLLTTDARGRLSTPVDLTLLLASAPVAAKCPVPSPTRDMMHPSRQCSDTNTR